MYFILFLLLQFKEKVPDEPVKILMAQEPVNIDTVTNSNKNPKQITHPSTPSEEKTSNSNIYHPPGQPSSSVTPSSTATPQRFIYKEIKKDRDSTSSEDSGDTYEYQQHQYAYHHQQHIQPTVYMAPPSLYISGQQQQVSHYNQAGNQPPASMASFYDPCQLYYFHPHSPYQSSPPS